ncbi:MULTISPECIES: hypothetical protein [Natronorubrum]|uniref:Uncharacterized protein n=2 Tax=Natronorubrum bangense TaxID=61858 RepID=L9WSG1_9EURY|nr:hypothetical protein [Natronorubrum bangense]ELY51248.1 hypothetical protein C494_02830 [Natronorubrum bangense JCM 10635]QCC54759.1 hypothetical protein DV706_09950 [Natronorubrum bangense]
MDTAETTSTLGIVLGAVLVVVGIAAYVVSDFASITALIPAVFGVIIAGFGVVGRQTERRRLAVIGIGVLALLGVVGSVRGISDVIALLTGGAVDSTVAAVAQGSMILVGLILLFAVGRELGRN